MGYIEAEHDGKVYRIENDLPEIGSYLYIFDGVTCTHDYLQDSVQMCKEFALEDFGVPIDSWKES